MKTISSIANCGTELYIITNRITENQVHGTIIIYDENGTVLFTCRSLELKFTTNGKTGLGIPHGEYKGEKITTPSHGRQIRLFSSLRDFSIVLRRGNYHFQSHECVLVGEELLPVYGKIDFDVKNSMRTMSALFEVMKNEFEIKVFRTVWR